MNKNEPLEYITSRVSFYSQEFYIAQGALIPRPETELLIDEVLAVGDVGFRAKCYNKIGEFKRWHKYLQMLDV